MLTLQKIRVLIEGRTTPARLDPGLGEATY